MPPQFVYRKMARVLTMAACCLNPYAAADEVASVDFERDVAPILITRCLECHHAGEAAGGLVLVSEQGLKKGGESGVAIDASDASASLLLNRIHAGEMPPPKKGQSSKLPERELQILERWIRGGASWPTGRTLDLYERTSEQRAGRDFWSLQPIRRPPVPDGPASQAQNAVDRFIESKLAVEKLSPAPPADRRTLMRRLSVDLVGLVPAAEELDAFAADPAPDAYSRLVERLLASPHFGERWGRHWLDVARFAETCGYERDQVKPHAWKYRDWVIESWNQDRPYDQFVREQLCGDALPQRTPDTVVATGFLRLGTWNDEPNDPEEYKYDRLEDLVDACCSAFLGLTVKCARCHDHKFDPIYQADYYRVAQAFWTGPIEARDAKLLGGPSAEELGYDLLGWTDVRRDPPPLHLLKKGDPRRPGAVADFQRLSFLGADAGASPAEAVHRRTQLASWILDRNNPLTARVIVNRLWQHHFGHGLVATASNFGFTGDRPSHPELLDWLADELIQSGWSLKHLHRLLVLSATYQQSSVHPEASEFERRDPQNRWWWRAERRRLDAESLRDALLLVSGELDMQLGGPSFRPTIAADALEGLSRKSAAWSASPAAEQRRRSVYIFAQRSLLPPLMTTFDFSDTTAPCPKRDVTIAAPQALALLNNEFVHERGIELARQVRAASGADLRDQVANAWRRTLSRSPTEAEMALGLQHLKDQDQRFSGQTAADLPEGSPGFASLASLCHVLLNSNEFLFVD